MAKIKSLRVREVFETSYGWIDMCRPETLRTKGYSLAAFPVGHEIPTDSNLVYVIGRNGSGKSTLLEKLASQYGPRKDFRFSLEETKSEEELIKIRREQYFDLEYEGSPPTCCVVRRSGEKSREKMLREVKEDMLSQRPDVEKLRRDPNAHLIFDSTPCTIYLTEEQKEIMDRLNSLSGGEMQRLHLMSCFAYGERQGTDYILLIDEPETCLDMVRKREFADAIQRRYESSLQTFVATHDADLIRRSPGDALVIKLRLEEPAEVIPAREFDVDKYVEEELEKEATVI